jgi:hypothetical protein
MNLYCLQLIIEILGNYLISIILQHIPSFQGNMQLCWTF